MINDIKKKTYNYYKIIKKYKIKNKKWKKK